MRSPKGCHAARLADSVERDAVYSLCHELAPTVIVYSMLYQARHGNVCVLSDELESLGLVGDALVIPDVEFVSSESLNDTCSDSPRARLSRWDLPY
ncbi:hypothetical protein LMH87_010801 [Akanthomyces muscarius]|uniref:Uncharacterized protein n=1 Tax=Akanthomyces muscarius TaxID=2231603 RepID=A0A9W8UK49_AKAMU|nr:hypothetical protein LMH87_010801 [Akanthomyces muscarius]KAJ4150034.1 hypothetical protein LMH87_010801 [Akanthomyces muscarius]